MGWDDIVVGLGLVGASVARRLAESGRRVLLVERGRAVSEPTGSHVRNTTAHQRDPDGYFAAIDHHFDYFDVDASAAGLPGAFTTSIVGGVGILWTNNCPRAVDGVDRPDLLSGAVWDRYYGIAEDYLEVRADQFDDSVRQRLVAQRLGPRVSEQGRELIRLPLSGWRGDGDAVHYVGPADVLAGSTGDLEVWSGRVDAVEIEAGRARSVRIDGTDHQAENVVLAAGAVDTPRLLWRSGLAPEALGRRLTYHPVLIGQIVLDADLCDQGAALDPRPRLCLPPTPARPWLVMLLRDTNPHPVDPSDRDVPANRLIEIQVFAPVDPDPGNRMGLSETGAIEFDVPLRDDDERRRRAIEDDVDDLCARLGRYRRGCEARWAELGSAHLMGSCRMGVADDGTSVADPDGRVWGVENLYLATNGLIPTALAVNPTLTATALGIRTADRIAATPDDRREPDSA